MKTVFTYSLVDTYASSTATSQKDTTCATADCGQPMTPVGEDISERLDIVPAEFFVHRHIYGKWTCRCCQRPGIERLVQEPAAPQIIDGVIAASGFAAPTLISRFVDHLPYYRQETINARSGVHTPRSTLARTAGNAGAAMVPLFEAHKRFVLSCPVLHADETPAAILHSGVDNDWTTTLIVSDRPRCSTLSTFLGLGLNNSGVWRVVAAVTNLIPYVGAASFDIHALIGNLLTPW